MTELLFLARAEDCDGDDRIMIVSEILALASVPISVGMNVGLYIHLSSIISTRFDSIERRLEMIQGDTHQMISASPSSKNNPVRLTER